MFQWFLPLTSRILNAALLFCWVQFLAFCGKGTSACPWSGPGVVQFGIFAKSLMYAILFLRQNILISPAPQWGIQSLLDPWSCDGEGKKQDGCGCESCRQEQTATGSPFVIFYHCTPEKISSGIQAIKRVIKLKQNLLAKSNVPGRGRSQVGTSRTGSKQF